MTIDTLPSPEAPTDASVAGGLGRWRAVIAPLLARWRTLQPRERSALALAGVVITFYAVWAVAVQPALETLREAPAQIDRLDADLQRMQRLAAEARDLRSATPVTAAQASLALKSATDRLGGRGQIVVQGDRATLTVTGVDALALRAWLIVARSAARARPVELRLTQSGAGYNGTLVLALADGS